MTAVEWFIEQIYIGKFATLRDQIDAIEQARIMEKQQIQDAFKKGQKSTLKIS